MARLDVFAISTRHRKSYVVDVQSRLLDHLSTHVVIPLVDMAAMMESVTLLNPVFDILGRQHMMLTQTITTLPTRVLKRPVASLDAHHDEVTRALDLLLTGF